MTDFVQALAQEAEAAIAALGAAALRARQAHAEAELARHMVATATKVAGLPRREAIRTVVTEWMKAWAVRQEDWPDLAIEMEAVTLAFIDHVSAPGPDTDAPLRRSWRALDDAFHRHGTGIADQMAWRSECAHRWWELVSPVPPDLPGGKPRPTIPPLDEATPFWMSGCAPHCLGQ